MSLAGKSSMSHQTNRPLLYVRNSLDICDPIWPEREEVFTELKR